MLFETVIISLVISLAFLVYEKAGLNRNIKKLKVRVLVTGTRGKSTVTELIRAGLSSKYSAVSKVTGTIPEITYPDGTVSVIRRKGGARVQEQIRTIRNAVLAKADCLSLECMSVTPALLQLETHILRPQIFVITNIRNDHREHLGTNPDLHYQYYCAAIPQNSVVFTADEINFVHIDTAAKAKNSRAVLAVNDAAMDNADIRNKTLAEAVCAYLGVDGKEEIAKCSENKGKSGGLIRLRSGASLIDLFSANDIDSTLKELEALPGYDEFTSISVVLNSRSDRPLRSDDYIKWMAELKKLGRIFLLGSHSGYVKRNLIRKGVEVENVFRLSPEKAAADLGSSAENGGLIATVGNIKGEGFQFMEHIQNYRIAENK